MTALAHPTFHDLADATDAELRAMLSRCSRSTLRARFLGTGPAVVEQLVASLSGAGSLVTMVARLDGVVVGIGSVEAPAPYELAVLVEDRWQRHGVGRQLAAALVAAAVARGVANLYVALAVDNVAARRLVTSLWPGARFTQPDAGVTECVLALRDNELIQRASRRAPPVANRCWAVTASCTWARGRQPTCLTTPRCRAAVAGSPVPADRVRAGGDQPVGPPRHSAADPTFNFFSFSAKHFPFGLWGITNMNRVWTAGLLAGAALIATACSSDPAPQDGAGSEQQGQTQIEQAIPEELRKDAEAFAKFRQIDTCALHNVDAATRVTGDKGDAIMPDDNGFHRCDLELHKSEFESTWTLRIEVGSKFDAADRHESKPENIGGLDVYTREMEMGGCSAWWQLDTDQPVEQQKFAIELSTSKPSGDAAGGKAPCDVVKQYLAAVGPTWKELPKRGTGRTTPEFKLATLDPCIAAAAVLEAHGPEARLDPVNPSVCTAKGSPTAAADGKDNSKGAALKETRVTFGIKDDPASLIRAGVEGASETTVDGRKVVLSQGRRNSCAAWIVWDPDTTVVVDHSDEDASTAMQQIRIDAADCDQAKSAAEKVLAKVGKP